MSTQSPTADVIAPADLALLAALSGNGRLPWHDLAERCGTSASTAHRRITRLIESGLVRVIGATDAVAAGFGISALTRVSCSAVDIERVQEELTARNDVRFCASVTGSASLVAEIVTHSLPALQAAVAEITADLPILRTESFPVTRSFTAPFTVFPPSSGTGTPEPLDNAPAPDATRGVPPLAVTATADERALLGALVADGRRPITDIAVQTGRAESVVRRTLDHLIATGRLRVGPLVAPAALGQDVALMMWLNVAPDKLRHAAAALARSPQVHTVTATLGRYNLVGQAFLPSAADVFAFSTDQLGTLPGVRDVDVTMQIHTSKRMWIGIAEGRFAPELTTVPSIAKEQP